MIGFMLIASNFMNIFFQVRSFRSRFLNYKKLFHYLIIIYSCAPFGYDFPIRQFTALSVIFIFIVSYFATKAFLRKENTSGYALKFQYV